MGLAISNDWSRRIIPASCLIVTCVLIASCSNQTASACHQYLKAWEEWYRQDPTTLEDFSRLAPASQKFFQSLNIDIQAATDPIEAVEMSNRAAEICRDNGVEIDFFAD